MKVYGVIFDAETDQGKNHTIPVFRKIGTDIEAMKSEIDTIFIENGQASFIGRIIVDGGLVYSRKLDTCWVSGETSLSLATGERVTARTPNQPTQDEVDSRPRRLGRLPSARVPVGRAGRSSYR